LKEDDDDDDDVGAI